MPFCVGFVGNDERFGFEQLFQVGRDLFLPRQRLVATLLVRQVHDAGFVIDEVELVLDEDQLAYTVQFYIPPPTDGWPVGTYKVEVYFNGVLNTTVEFSVQ